ncbi:hypothetical protein HDV03_000434 [Kappamyces sp. JEL0829]|nr:hypothetical protein HDV03_000434 [Kappamyces sp. JEL0829]
MTTTAFLLHKPRGVVSSKVDRNPPLDQATGLLSVRRTVWDLAANAGYPVSYGLAGRLDCETSGVILFSNSSKLLDALTRPPPFHSPLLLAPVKTKEYVLTLLSSHQAALDDDFDSAALVEALSSPLSLTRNGHTIHCRPAKVEFMARWRDSLLSRGHPNLGWCIQVKITLSEGKHHQIRRMAKRAGYPHIVSLHRTRIAGMLHVESVPVPGDCRWLSETEIDDLHKQLGL